jgi:hypothetical protein
MLGGNGMTDNEIIKALECCFVNSNCNGCPQLSKSRCLQNACENAFYFINRLKAENEALISAQETVQKHIEKAKAEAIKEVVGRLQKSIISQLGVSTLEKKEAFCFCLDEIDEIESEMVGDTK